ncbi:hypothetical protein [Hymenobacter profundi]|nr:hypothetical protein [Hymenobacter profundi]
MALFLVLIGAGLAASNLLGSHYSIIGSVASFLALFVAFQSWKAADNASRKTDEALQKMQQISQETQQLVERSNTVEGHIDKAVTTISDATRQLYHGFQPIMTEIRKFLDDAKGSEYVAILTDSASIGTFYSRHHQPPLNPRETQALTDRIQALLVDRARDAREFYMATLTTEETSELFPPTKEANTLFHSYTQGVWQQFHPELQITAAEWNEHRQAHYRVLHAVKQAFQETAAQHTDQTQAQLPPHYATSVLPLQLFIRADAQANEPFRALVVFLGQYNLDRVADARAMQTADPELVRTFISMFESLTGQDDMPSYRELRRRVPL